jgi:hypothetical protein
MPKGSRRKHGGQYSKFLFTKSPPLPLPPPRVGNLPFRPFSYSSPRAVTSSKASCPATHHAREERKCSTYSFLTSTIDGVSDQRHAAAALYLWINPGTHRIGGWVGLRDDLEVRGKILCLCRGKNPGHPVCTQILYCLSYSSPEQFRVVKKCILVLNHTARRLSFIC